MLYPVDLSLLTNSAHMPALPTLERSMNRPDLRLHDFCIPINPYFPTQAVLQELRHDFDKTLRYYPSGNSNVSRLLADFLGMCQSNIVAANGSTELITWINERLIQTSLATDVPTFGRWTDNANELGRRLHTFPRDKQNGFQLDAEEFVRYARNRHAKALVLCNPNNPTGGFLNREEVLTILDASHAYELVVIDESFIDFAQEGQIPSVAEAAINYHNVVVLKSLGKCLGLHGLRCGYAVACEKLATQLRRMLPPWNVNALAEEFIRSLIAHRNDYELSRQRVVRDSAALHRRLGGIDGLTPYRTRANFVYCELDADLPGTTIRNELLQQAGCFVRECGSKIGSSSQFLRIAARPPQQQDLLLSALREVLSCHRESPRPSVRITPTPIALGT